MSRIINKPKLPVTFLESLKGTIGFDENAFKKIHDSGEQVTSVRFNSSKLPTTNHDLPIAMKVPWSEYGFYLRERPTFTLDPLFHAGVYYVQEASSMFLEEVMKQAIDLQKPLRILDLCAAPGGKSTLLQSLISPSSLLVSNEVIKSRASTLTENIIKWGASNVVVTNNNSKDFQRLENYFDVIVVDAPCSGSGLFRKEPLAIVEWSDKNVMLCSQRQQNILTDVMPALKQSGMLIYSTCSYSNQENEEILDWITDKYNVNSIAIKLNKNWNVIESRSQKHHCYGYRFYPDKIQGEGFFISILQKSDGNNFSLPGIKNTSFERLSKVEENIVRTLIKPETEIKLQKKEERVYAFPYNLSNDINFIHSSLYIKKAGTLLGKIAGEELIPEHELALSKLVGNGVPTINLTKAQALRYLRREDIVHHTQIKGWSIVKYENQNLGWVKILPNRINNYYPGAWRIRMG
jgi:16S rRNA C967 or C1407 C5-methylase (RsmB/RsmF family)/NOL1/NOP2/fmu family ribosome biogenesis protein